MSVENDRLVQTPRTDRRSVRFDLPDAAAVDRLVETGEVENFSAFVRTAVANELVRQGVTNE